MTCPKCGSDYTYEQDHLMVCSQCFHEWDPAEAGNEDKVFDAITKIGRASCRERV